MKKIRKARPFRKIRVVRRETAWRKARDSDKLVIYGLDPLFKTAFRTLAVIRGMENAEVLAWLLRTHPDVRATVREVRKQSTGPKAR